MPDQPPAKSEPPRRKPRPCPICQAMSVPKYHPFCSARCADIDLHKWFSGQYAVPAVEPPDDFDAETGPPRGDDDED